MDYKVFANLHEAREELHKMCGWPEAKTELICYPDHELATRRGNIIVIRCNDSQYLRDDGYVR